MKKLLIVMFITVFISHFNDMAVIKKFGKQYKSFNKKNKKINIFDLVKKDNFKKVKISINNNANLVNAKNRRYKGKTLLHVAATEGFLKTVKLLINKRADVNVKDSFGKTPLHVAAENGYLDIAKLLIENHADVNVRDNFSKIPLHCAAIGGHQDIVKFLIENNANVNFKNHWGDTPLHQATINGHKDVAELLIEGGADVNVKGKYGTTPLHWAASRCHLKIVKLLIATPLLLKFEQGKDKADKKYKKVKYKLNLNDLKPEKKELLKKWFNRKSMFDLLMVKTDDKSNNEKAAPLLCVELIADKLFETPFKNPIELHNAKAFLNQCFINKDVKINENELKYPGAQCFIEALYKHHLFRLKLYIDEKNNNNETAIEIAGDKNIKKYLEDIQKADTYEDLQDELKNKVKYN